MKITLGVGAFPGLIVWMMLFHKYCISECSILRDVMKGRVLWSRSPPGCKICRESLIREGESGSLVREGRVISSKLY